MKSLKSSSSIFLLLIIFFLGDFIHSESFAYCSDDTLISTPKGNVKISKIKFGDFVLSYNKEVVRVIKISKVKVKNHKVIRVKLDNDVVLKMNLDHPIGPIGPKFRDLMVGHEIDGHSVVLFKLIPYKEKYIYDILPQSRSGTYYANGILIGSSLWKVK